MSARFIMLMAFSYVLGNISPSTLLAKARGIDIKKEGSGNAGTTNALRVMGAKAALITMIVDIGKGVLASVIAMQTLGMPYAGWCALAVFLGHVWPLLLRFRGGKGVATAFGALLAIDWRIALICMAAVVLVVMAFRMVSLGSVSAAVLFPILCFFMNRDLLISGTVMAAILIFKHRGNIVRIVRGEENKLSFGK